MKKDLEKLREESSIRAGFENLDYGNYLNRKKYRQEKIRALKAKQEYIKARNKTYLKGQRGVRRYYDEDKAFVKEDPYDLSDYIDKNGYLNDYDDNFEKKLFRKLKKKKKVPIEEQRQIKCVFTKDTRRASLFNYFKYLKGKKVLVRDLAWKFAVTERTIQHDLRFLENNGFITIQANKTFKGKQTKNSYIVNLEKQNELPFDNTYLFVCFIGGKDGEYYVLTKTNYKPQEECTRKFKPMQECNFSLPQIKLHLETKLDEKSLNMANKLFNSKLENNYKGYVYSGYYTKDILHIDWDSYDELDNPLRNIEHRKTRVVYSWFLLDTLLTPPNGYMWIALNGSNRKINHTLTNKCLKKIKEFL